MRIRRLLLAAAVVAPLFAAPAPGAAFPGDFDFLVRILRDREAGLLGDPSPEARVQLRAVQDSLREIEASGTLAADGRVLGRASARLVRALPGEFTAPGPLAADLSDAVEATYQALFDRLFRAREDLEARALGLRPATAWRVRVQADRAAARLNRALRAPDFRTAGRRLSAGAAALDRGTRIADADTIKE